MTRSDLQNLAEWRLIEAKTLLKVSPSGAYYLAGYAAECALKACFIRSRHDEFPDRLTDRQARENDPYTHDLVRLLRLARLESELGDARSSDPRLATNWNIVASWNEESRYAIWGTQEARGLLEALDDADHGVMRWLREHW